MKGFLYYNTYYSYLVGIRIQGTIGKHKPTTNTNNLHPITYRVRHGKQEKYNYTISTYKRTPNQDKQRNALKYGVLAWQVLPLAEKKYYWELENGKRIKSGYNYFLSNYIKNFIT